MSTQQAVEVAEAIWEGVQQSGGLMPQALYESLARVAPQGSPELVLLDITNDEPEVYLTRRPATCPHWPEQWHMPGTTIRPLDQGLDQVLERLLAAEVRRLLVSLSVVSLHVTSVDDRVRGACMHALLVGIVSPASRAMIPTGPSAVWSPITSLPTPMVHHHELFIDDLRRYLMRAEKLVRRLVQAGDSADEAWAQVLGLTVCASVVG